MRITKSHCLICLCSCSNPSTDSAYTRKTAACVLRDDFSIFYFIFFAYLTLVVVSHVLLKDVDREDLVYAECFIVRLQTAGEKEGQRLPEEAERLNSNR